MENLTLSQMAGDSAASVVMSMSCVPQRLQRTR